MNLIAIWIGKLTSFFIKTLNLGAGATWPGEIAQRVNPRIFSELIGEQGKKIILVAGTNGKTTTVKLITSILKAQNSQAKVVTNQSGANLLNGLIYALIENADLLGKIRADYFIFEVDENVLPLVLSQIDPKVVILLNLFRDQLDRYGEVDLIADKWRRSLIKYNGTVILNADDPQIAYIGKETVDKKYFGLSNKNFFLSSEPHATDSIYCPICSKRLKYLGYFLSHQGIWKCVNCKFSRPELNIKSKNWPSSLLGVYNMYNVMAAVLAVKEFNLKGKAIKRAIIDFRPAFGRQEEFSYKGKKIKILLSKNPTGFNESIRTLIAGVNNVAYKKVKMKKMNSCVLLILNDRIPDGRDVSWIWDVDIEDLIFGFKTIIVSGDRVYDMGLRAKYACETLTDLEGKIVVLERVKDAINQGVRRIKKGETFYILATYSAMLEVRKIITGKKIL